MRNAFNELLKKFNLNTSNPTLDCVDISHHSGSNAKASIVRFNINGPDKGLYRYYNIPFNLGGNDTESIKFAIKKRLKRKDEIPSILLVDGGKAQLNAAIPEIKNKDILLLAIKKGSQRKAMTETIYSIFGQESIKVNSKLFNLLSKARDEAHRFAIKANRHAKSKNINISILDSVYGVGPKIKQSLFNKFKSINVILDANEADLISVDGISKKIAKDIMKLKKK